MKVNKFTKFLLRYFPWLVIRQAATEIDIPYNWIKKAESLFRSAESIDFFPLLVGRSFMLVLDRKFALYFHQNDDNFRYDGFEIGKYNKGDVTIFDELEKRPDPFYY